MKQIQKKTTIDIEQVSKLEALLSEYKSMKTEFDQFTYNMLEILIETETEKYEEKEKHLMDELDTIRDVSSSAEVKIKLYHRKLCIQTNRDSLIPGTSVDLNKSFISSSTSPKQDKIAVPTFNGDILSFSNFKNLFENPIHEKEELTNVQKMYYSKQACTNKAANIMQNFSVTGEAYPEAWSYLLSRYDNPKAVIRTLFHKLHTLEAIKHETKIRNLLDHIEIILKGLEAASESIDGTFSRYIVYHVTTLLDSKTNQDWENSITSSNVYPNFSALDNFLSTRIFATEGRLETKSVKTVKEEKKNFDYHEKTIEKRSSFAANTGSKLKCVVCCEPHYLSKSFLSKIPIERHEIVKIHKLCIKCFNTFYRLAECKKNSCHECDQNHYSLLHRENLAVKTQTTANQNEKSTHTPSSNFNLSKKPTLTTIATRKSKILQTAVVKVRTQNDFVLTRILLDVGSMETLARQPFLRHAKIPTSPLIGPAILIGVTLDKTAHLVLRSCFTH